MKSHMTFKPDVYSAVGVYRNNDWGLRPTLFSSTYCIREGKGLIESNVAPNWRLEIAKNKKDEAAPVEGETEEKPSAVEEKIPEATNQ